MRVLLLGGLHCAAGFFPAAGPTGSGGVPSPFGSGQGKSAQLYRTTVSGYVVQAAGRGSPRFSPAAFFVAGAVFAVLAVGTERMFTNRTYGRRLCRALKDSQSKLMREFLPLVSIDLSDSGDQITPTQYFDKIQPVWMEVGFGGGEHLAALAKQNPDINFIGCEPFTNGVVSMLAAIDEDGLQNVRILNGNALDLIPKLQARSLARFYLMFADPWPKKRHHKRRFIQQEILDILIPKIVRGSELRLATDHADYQSWMLEKLRARGDIEEILSTFEKPRDWPGTRYEAKALEEGRPPLYLIFRVL
jgi:tRNA (guanine-N7-)-methyltransferase